MEQHHGIELLQRRNVGAYVYVECPAFARLFKSVRRDRTNNEQTNQTATKNLLGITKKLLGTPHHLKGVTKNLLGIVDLMQQNHG